MSDGPITVAEFNALVNKVVTTSDPITNIVITGEISEIKEYPSGFYFSMRDEKAVVACTFYRYAASRSPLFSKLEVGTKINAMGSASYYEKNGSFKFNISSIELAGEGEQQKALRELKEKLAKEGLFDTDRKRPIPRYPKVIGVVTSPKGAVIKDIIDTTARRYPVDILLSPATVQGTDAPKSIIRAIELLKEQNIDVMIVGRGGGSADDLSAFNDEEVVRAIYGCGIPVISAVGHATDKSLCDLVADKYAETPTAAAMLATPDRKDENRNVDNILLRMENSIKSITDRMRAKLDYLDRRLSPSNAKSAIEVYSGRVRIASDRMDSVIKSNLLTLHSRFALYDSQLNPKRLADRIDQYSMTVDECGERMDRAVQSLLKTKNMELKNASAMMEGLDPNNVLQRGYSIIRGTDGKVVTSAKDMFPGTDVTIAMRDGKALAKIKELKLDE